MKKSLLLTILLAAVLAAPGCKKKQPPPQPQMPPQEMPAPPGMGGGMPGGSAAEKKVVVPDEVRSAWKSVKIAVNFKQKGERKDFIVPLNSEFKVPGTGLTLKPGAFLPHFKMEPGVITSASNQPENPAVQIEVFEDGKEIFHGWLFAKFPEVHALAHENYAVALVEGVKK